MRKLPKLIKFESRNRKLHKPRKQHVYMQSRTQSMAVRRLGAGHDSGETE